MSDTNETPSGAASRDSSLATGSDDIPEWVRKGAAEILSRRANEIGSFKHDYAKHVGADYKMLGSVEHALSREMARLRRMAEALKPEEPDEFDEDVD